MATYSPGAVEAIASSPDEVDAIILANFRGNDKLLKTCLAYPEVLA